MEIFTPAKTIAKLALEKGKKVNLSSMAEKRGMKITNFRLNDGSSIKLLEGPGEVDCVIMKKGKVLSAKGIFMDDPIEAKILADNATTKIATRKDIEPVRFDDLYPIDYFNPELDYFA